MGLLSPEMKAELAKISPRVYPALELDLSQGGRYSSLPFKRISKPGLASPTNGAYEPLAKRFGTVRRSVADRQRSIQTPETEIVVDDTSLWFSNALGCGTDLRGSPATFWLTSPNVPVASWFQYYTGILYDWKASGTREWSLHFRPDDRALTSPFPNTYLSKTAFPTMDPSSEGVLAPVIYGMWDSTGLGNGGAVQGYLIDNVNWRYVFAGHALNVLRVYKDGTLVTTGNPVFGWAIGEGTRFGGVHFGSANPQGTSTITADVVGIDYTGGMSLGLSVLNPADQIRHLLSNFAFTDGRNPASYGFDGPSNFYPITQAPCDNTLWTALATTYRGPGAPIVGARYITSQTTGMQELLAWAQTFQLDLYWTNLGKIGVAFDPVAAKAPYITTPWFSYPDITSLQPAWESDDGVRTINSAYSNDKKNLYVQDLRVPYAGGDTVDAAWAPAFL